ncbi:hypothetical protein RJ640_001311 [Escallonia rubra]|uniref:Clp R domain-containing protein n=1 Tax=Escallonia rubra TaxID=112253 RepID=A0AA88QXN7_9ASTE|nr:hypothetical protein RJ640_001311 [Escallonia rubra]
MRAGGYTLQQSLTADAASMVKQAVSLARRRGHAQVTPLHVASAMLATQTGLFRKSCLQSHSHPLQCKALELCFNVALNRLPTSTSSSTILGPHHSHHPSMSNSLVAAFKRAQAHQRRGLIENQQQPILALKVEIEQLIISVLDDPSVSRVMREAGFSSTQVKTNVEQAVSLEISSQSPTVSCIQSKESTKPLVFGANWSQFLPTSKSSDKVGNRDVMSVIDTMMNSKRKNIVVVGECLVSAESVVKGVVNKFERGEILGVLRFVQFVSLPLFTLRNSSREEVEEKLGELRYLVKCNVGRGVVLYLGDLKWVSDFWSNFGEQRSNYYCPLQHMIMELSRFLRGLGESGKLWLLGIATFQTFMRCKTGKPSLETLWELHPLTIPAGSLELGLRLDRECFQDKFRSKILEDGSSWPHKAGAEKQLTCCADCSFNFTREARSVANIMHSESITATTCSSLPSWLQRHKEENRKQTLNDQEYEQIRSLCKKWNSICSSVHKHPLFLENPLHFQPSPSSSTSMSSLGKGSPNLQQTLQNWPVIFDNPKSPKELQFFIPEHEGEGFESNLGGTKPDLLSNPNSSPNSASSSEASEGMECSNLFKVLNPKNSKILSKALEKRVPWQRGIIPEIVSTVLQCRSGTMGRKSKMGNREDKEETWLFFLGVDSEGKEKISKELAKVLFGSQSKFFAIGLSSFSSTRADSTEEISNKRARDEHGKSYLERFAEAVQENPSRVFFLEDVEQVDYHSQVGVKKAIESGKITLPGGELVHLEDAVVIFSCESFSSVSRACSPPIRQRYGENEDKDPKTGNDLEEIRPCGSIDLNLSFEDDKGDEHSVSEIGILDSVDRQVIFKIQTL